MKNIRQPCIFYIHFAYNLQKHFEVNVKRSNIYLYEYSNGSKGKNVGFCRMDINNNAVKILLNIKYNELGINLLEIVDIKGQLLFDGGESEQFSCNDLKKLGQLVKTFELSQADGIVGVMLEYQKINGIKVRVQGTIGDKAWENAMKINNIEQVELDDTVYNVDTECLKEKRINPEANCEKEENKREIIKIRYNEITTLPREYWRVMKNKFVICGCNRYGHLAYIKEQDRYIICVPGVMNDKNAMCAKRYGFKTYFPNEDSGEDEVYNGYWVMNVTNNSKL